MKILTKVGRYQTPTAKFLNNAHTLRELEALIEFEKEPWVSDMQTILLDGLKLTKTARTQCRDAVAPEAIRDIEHRFDACCKQAITLHKNQPPLPPVETKEARSTETAHRAQSRIAIQGPESGGFTLLDDLIVPFTTNEAERDLRTENDESTIEGLMVFPNRGRGQGLVHASNRHRNNAKTRPRCPANLENRT